MTLFFIIIFLNILGVIMPLIIILILIGIISQEFLHKIKSNVGDKIFSFILYFVDLKIKSLPKKSEKELEEFRLMLEKGFNDTEPPNTFDEYKKNTIVKVNNLGVPEYIKKEKTELPIIIFGYFFKSFIIFLCLVLILIFISFDYFVITKNTKPFMELKTYIKKKI